MEDGSPYTSLLAAEVRREVYIYFEDAVYHRFAHAAIFDGMVPFEQFGPELARMVSGDRHCGGIADTFTARYYHADM